MRPSRLLLWLGLGAIALALIASVSTVAAPEWGILPFAVLICATILDWMISVRPGLLDLEVNCPGEVFSGEATKLGLLLSHKRGRQIPDRKLRARLTQTDGFIFEDDCLFIGGRADIDLMARRRGRWAFEKVWFFWRSRLGLIDFVPVYTINCEISVVPNIRPVTSGAIELELNTTTHGMKQTTMRGEGSEFHQLNDYVQGMDPRSIDWKHSARHHRLVAKEMRAERNHPIIIALDNGYLMKEEISGLPRIDHKINAALALAWAGVLSGDRIGLYTFDARPRLFVPPQGGRTTFTGLRSRLAALTYQSVETNHALALATLHERLNRRSLIVVFSDFADPLAAELLLEHLTVLKRHHVVVFVSLHDPLLETLTMQGVQSMDDVARSISADNLLLERRLVFERMAALGVDVVETAPGAMTPKVLNAYLAIKSRELI